MFFGKVLNINKKGAPILARLFQIIGEIFN